MIIYIDFKLIAQGIFFAFYQTICAGLIYGSLFIYRYIYIFFFLKLYCKNCNPIFAVKYYLN